MGTLLFKIVASDFEKELNKESTARRGIVTKGAFGLTYVRRSERGLGKY